MLFILLLIAITLISVGCTIKSQNSGHQSNWYYVDETSTPAAVISGVVLAAFLFALPVVRSNTNHHIAAIHQLQKEINDNREFFMHERAEVTRVQIIEENKWIVDQKLDLTDVWFSIYTSKEVLTLTEIK